MLWLAQIQTQPVTIPGFTVPSIVIAVLIAIVIGLVAQLVIGYSHIGFFGHIVVGILGAFLGNLIAYWFKLPPVFVVAGIDLVWTIMGTIILVVALAFLVGGRRYRGYYNRRRGYNGGGYGGGEGGGGYGRRY